MASCAASIARTTGCPSSISYPLRQRKNDSSGSSVGPGGGGVQRAPAPRAEGRPADGPDRCLLRLADAPGDDDVAGRLVARRLEQPDGAPVARERRLHVRDAEAVDPAVDDSRLRTKAERG